MVLYALLNSQNIIGKQYHKLGGYSSYGRNGTKCINFHKHKYGVTR